MPSRTGARKRAFSASRRTVASLTNRSASVPSCVAIYVSRASCSGVKCISMDPEYVKTTTVGWGGEIGSVEPIAVRSLGYRLTDSSTFFDACGARFRFSQRTELFQTL
jgi:hypothetical protein